MATFAITMLVSKDVIRSRNFYHDIFGLKIGTDQAPHWVDFDLGNGVLLGLHPEDDQLSVQTGSIFNGFAVDDVDAFIDGLRPRGIRIAQEPQDEPFGRLALIVDPDGYIVQVFTPQRH